MMRSSLIEKIKENTILEIKGIKYEVKSKVCYYTENSPLDYYFKIKFTNDMVLVISEDLATILLGKEVYLEEVIEFSSQNEIIYDSERYVLVTSDYQFVKYIEFGNYGEYETECRFMDYANEDESKIISLGINTFTNKREDVYAEKIKPSELRVI